MQFVHPSHTHTLSLISCSHDLPVGILEARYVKLLVDHSIEPHPSFDTGRFRVERNHRGTTRRYEETCTHAAPTRGVEHVKLLST